jgi:thiol-disulfide isomerase/thioredoxin
MRRNLIKKIQISPIFLFICIIILMSGFAGKCFCAEQALVKAGDVFPKIALKPPVDPKDAAYLGISGKSPFFFSDVKADLLLVEIMNIHCGHCQQQAPILNQLFSLIESSPETKDRIKIMAISAGNSEKDIQQFRDQFKTPYPIVEDPSLKVFDLVGKPGVPFVIYIRPMIEGKSGLVAGIHKGFTKDYEAMFREMKVLVEKDLASILRDSEKVENQISTVEPVLTEEELIEKIRSAFTQEGNIKGKMDTIELDHYGKVYSFLMESQGQSIRLFAKSVSEPPPCDQCHDVHFIFVFDETGKIHRFIPVNLSKYGNKQWDNADIEKIWKKVSGSNIGDSMQFDEKVDAVSSATITSVVIFKNIYDNKGLLDALKAKD